MKKPCAKSGAEKAGAISDVIAPTPYKHVTGLRKPVGITRKETNRQRLIARHGLAVVEALEGLGDYE